MHTPITFITGNAAKAEQLARHLDHPIAHKKLDLYEIQSLNLKEIVAHKAREAFTHVHAPVLVEDVSLVFYSLGRLPGPLIKWFLAELGNEGLCRMLEGRETRSALAEVCFGLFDGRDTRFFEGSMAGSIALSPQGAQGFGWDPIFIPEGAIKTWGEMAPEEQKETSMRRIALKKLESFLKSQ